MPETFVPRSPAPSPREILDASGPTGGFTKVVLAQWGVPWPPPKGWREQLFKLWATEKGAVDYDAQCSKTGRTHLWADATPRGAAASRLWVCSDCDAITVTRDFKKQTAVKGTSYSRRLVS